MGRLPEDTLRKGILPTFYRGESYSFYRREVDYKGLIGAVTTMIYHTIRNIEGIHKLAILSTTLTLNMQL
jgi:hypothetical protein